MPNDANPSILIELCALCPIEPACERRQMLDHVNCTRHGEGQEPAASLAVKGHPYRCWLLSVKDKPADGH